MFSPLKRVSVDFIKKLAVKWSLNKDAVKCWYKTL